MTATLTGLESAYEECSSITRREAKNFYYAFLTLPLPRRRAISVVYAFCRHCDDSVDTHGSTKDKLDTLAEIREDLAKSYLHNATAPIFLALGDVSTLLVDNHIYRTTFVIYAIVSISIANILESLANNTRNIYVSLG